MIDPLLELTNLGFSKIAQKIELLKGSPELNEYLSSLLINDRVNRQGFPPKVVSILINISLGKYNV
jgi:hypothetical protein